jgi:lipopolysaccharide/colanic/teichoic acid biosynthesis glycosyltransferase
MFGFLKRNRSKQLRNADRFLSAGEMERLLIKERIRCDRYQQFFSLIVVHFNQVPEMTRATQELSLARFLASKLRVIDDFGLLRNGGMGVLLPMTDIVGGKVVLSKILNHANHHGLSIEADVFAYHGRLTKPPIKAGEDDLEDSNAKAENLLKDFDTNDSSLPSCQAYQTETAARTIKTNIVRADKDTQTIVRSSIELLSLCSKAYPRWKRLLDIVGASIGLSASIPILILASVAIKMTSQGPIIFKQSRCGQFGRPFLIYKLRTMSNNAEQIKHLLEDLNERDGPAFKIQHDPRVTSIGKFLRATGIDEIPQLINVLKGEMALVGPRPLPVAEEEECSTWQQRRLDTKPGITCLWQISKSRKMAFDEWMRLDLHYLKKRSLIFDMSLILRTIKAVFMGRVGH